MFIWFKTDSVVNKKGFYGVYSVGKYINYTSVMKIYIFLTEVIIKWSFTKLNPFLMWIRYLFEINCIGYMLMVSVLTSDAIDCGFELWSGQTREYKIGVFFFFI